MVVNAPISMATGALESVAGAAKSVGEAAGGISSALPSTFEGLAALPRVSAPIMGMVSEGPPMGAAGFFSDSFSILAKADVPTMATPKVNVPGTTLFTAQPALVREGPVSFKPQEWGVLWQAPKVEESAASAPQFVGVSESVSERFIVTEMVQAARVEKLLVETGTAPETAEKRMQKMLSDKGILQTVESTTEESLVQSRAEEVNNTSVKPKAEEKEKPLESKRIKISVDNKVQSQRRRVAFGAVSALVGKALGSMEASNRVIDGPEIARKMAKEGKNRSGILDQLKVPDTVPDRSYEQAKKQISKLSPVKISIDGFVLVMGRIRSALESNAPVVIGSGPRKATRREVNKVLSRAGYKKLQTSYV